MIDQVGRVRALEAQIVSELAAGNHSVAFRLADRRCRILPSPRPHCYVLRAEALDRLGRRDLAVDNIRRVLAQYPEDGPACARMLAWGEGPERSAAALALVRHAADPVLRKQAHQHLLFEGRRKLAFVQVSHRRITGWAVWDGAEPIEVVVTDGRKSAAWRVNRDPTRFVDGLTEATRFDLPRPSSSRVQAVTVNLQGEVLASARAAPNRFSSFLDGTAPVLRSGDARGSDDRSFRHGRRARSPAPRFPATGKATSMPAEFASADVRSSETGSQPRSAGGDRVCVIVPIFSDFEATRACLESLTAALGAAPQHRAILVDDATPDARIRGHLASRGGEPGIRILHNEQNLGFVGSVNRALDEAPDGDVILLNADTIVPLDFIDRLSQAARSSRDIGTVTPLSNNGEFTSFPLPNASNPLPGAAAIAATDAIASRCNGGRLIDLPSGIGFCLYITRACLAATGGLSEDYHRGYLEDADFCLRARDRGFRNVCAPSVFVGHVGSRSFAAEKRTLVVRNLDILERRFPGHRSECAAFMAADPLGPARAAIERSLLPSSPRPRLLLTSAGVVAEIARARARRLRHRAVRCLIVEIETGTPHAVARIYDPTGGVPQSLRFDFAEIAERRAFSSYCGRLDPSRMEVFDRHALSPAVLTYLRATGLRFDLVIADATFLGLCHPEDAQPLQSRLPERSKLCISQENGGRTWAPSLADLVEKAGQILLPDCDAAALMPARFRWRAKLREEFASRHAARRRPPSTEAAGHLGLVPVTRSWRERHMIGAIAQALRRLRPDIATTVLGSLPDDDLIMRSASFVVTGDIDDPELDQTIEIHGIRQVLIAFDRPLFGHPRVELLRRCGLPVAFADWTRGRAEPQEGDLRIDPSWTLDRTLDRLAQWLPRPTPGVQAGAQRN